MVPKGYTRVVSKAGPLKGVPQWVPHVRFSRGFPQVGPQVWSPSMVPNVGPQGVSTKRVHQGKSPVRGPPMGVLQRDLPMWVLQVVSLRGFPQGFPLQGSPRVVPMSCLQVGFPIKFPLVVPQRSRSVGRQRLVPRMVPICGAPGGSPASVPRLFPTGGSPGGSSGLVSSGRSPWMGPPNLFPWVVSHEVGSPRVFPLSFTGRSRFLPRGFRV